MMMTASAAAGQPQNIRLKPAPLNHCFRPLADIDADSTEEIDVIKYTLELEPYHHSDRLYGMVKIQLRPASSSLDTLRLDCEGLTIEGVLCGSDSLDFVIRPGTLEIHLRQLYYPGDTLEVEISYTAPATGWDETGYHIREEYRFTSSEPYGARRWFPCNDQPFDKAEVETFILVPSGFRGIGNGILVEVIPAPFGLQYHWAEAHPAATYLVFLTSGPYLEIEDIGPGQIPLRYYIYPEDSLRAVYDFANTPDMMGFFADLFGPYPFQMYGMAEAHIFNGWGAMEHQSVTTFGFHLISGDRSYENVVAHELSHMWWGNCLTPLTFADIWLNEGFAVYSEALYIESRYDTLRDYMRNIAEAFFYEDLNLLRYSIHNPPPQYLFGAAVYFKGAWVQHMLRNIIGDSAFFAGLRNYRADYAYGNVITQEYMGEMEAAYGGDLSWFFDQWVFEAGYPEYDYEWNYAQIPSGFTVDFTLRQAQSNAPIFRMPLEFRFDGGYEDTLITVWNQSAEQNYTFVLDFEPRSFVLDPGEKILKWDLPAGISPGRQTGMAVRFTLGMNYPNPFNCATIIPFTVTRPGYIKLMVFNALGEKAAGLREGYFFPGEYWAEWNAEGISAGVYYAVLAGGWQRKVLKTALVK